MIGREIILALSYKYKGDYDRIIYDVKKGKDIENKLIYEAKKAIGKDYICILDEDYPKELKRKMFKPPIILFYKGDINLLKNINFSNNISIVGTRKCTYYGAEATDRIIKGLPKDIVIISGLARGIDRLAHTKAMEYGLKTIAVLGSGIDYVYPSSNKDVYEAIIKNGGLILSEYPLSTPPSPEKFVFRNRIVAALSNYLLVVEAFNMSGTSTTVNYALQSNNGVGCIPSPIGDESMCNSLIKEGADLIETSEDLLFYAKILGD